MKRLLGIVVLGLLFISAPSKADDISEFEIEGMSIGDSLLDFFSETKINSFESQMYELPEMYKYKRIYIFDEKY